MTSRKDLHYGDPRSQWPWNIEIRYTDGSVVVGGCENLYQIGAEIMRLTTNPALGDKAGNPITEIRIT
jgi:hypothetical protein